MVDTSESLTVDIRGAARLVGIPYGTFRRMVKNGRAPAGLQPMPRVIRFRVDELRAWVAAGMPPRAEWVNLWQGAARPRLLPTGTRLHA